MTTETRWSQGRTVLPLLISFFWVVMAYGGEGTPRLGINLAGPADWNTELPFVDVFRLSRPWISQQKGKPWGQGPTLELDEFGWVKRLEPDCWAETLMCTIDGGHYPSGEYVVLYRGKGKITLWGAARVSREEPGRIIIDVDSSKGAIFLQIRETDPADYIRDIRVIMPGFENTYAHDPFHPVFLRRWKGVSCFRFMDWMETNGSAIKTWGDRPTLQHATFSGRGVALEWMIELCNRQKADAWFCMPHQADDDFVRQFARMVKASLDPKLKVYIEYSNEVWNGIFPQHRFAAGEGQKLGFGEKPWEAAWRYTAYRSVQIFRIWEEEFGGRERLVCVLPSQAANPYVSQQIVTFHDAYRHADVLAIAPYISMNIPKEGRELRADEVAEWTVDEVLDYVEKRALPEAIGWMKNQKAVADRYGLKLVAYEAGQHLVGVAGGENNEKLTALLMAANKHPRMAEIYRRYLEAWEEVGGDLLCHFSSVSRWSKWGSWGLLEYYDEDERLAPKFMAVMRWAKRLGQGVFAPE
ncbi:MAG: hypothetical protein NZ899_00140 [Thermoguttaceae bacterium]|nr:hypothetical protein [Thermoguttaceae bacterium]MDW8077306.1 hypothetical protein [Thermoguttaceae bacterium]